MARLREIITALLLTPSVYGERLLQSMKPNAYNEVWPRFAPDSGCTSTLWITQNECTTSTSTAQSPSQITMFATVVQTTTEFTATRTNATTITVTGAFEANGEPTGTGSPHRIVRRHPSPSDSKIGSFGNCSQITTVTSTTFSCIETETHTEFLKIETPVVTSTTTLYENIKTEAVEQTTVVVTVPPNGGNPGANSAPPVQPTTPSLAQQQTVPAGALPQGAPTTSAAGRAPTVTQAQQPSAEGSISNPPNGPALTRGPIQGPHGPSSSPNGSNGQPGSTNGPAQTPAPNQGSPSNPPKGPNGQPGSTNGPAHTESNPPISGNSLSGQHRATTTLTNSQIPVKGSTAVETTLTTVITSSSAGKPVATITSVFSKPLTTATYTNSSSASPPAPFVTGIGGAGRTSGGNMSLGLQVIIGGLLVTFWL